MNHDAQSDVQAIFEQLIGLPIEERHRQLNEACRGNAELRREVEALLAAHAAAPAFLAAPTASIQTVTPGTPISEKPGTRIGPYKLLQVIGEGGFGVVFMAEQETPIRRRVALKIIKLGMDTRQVIARFEAERQALALMDHPHIARVFDGGATETPSPAPSPFKGEGWGEGRMAPSPFKGEGRGEGLPAGRPYFVMEYVKGDPITEFADARKLNIRERLELFGQVCSAVQHAHTKGIIHRDIKPRNVLTSMVDGKPFARVIDFGIAKATGSPLTEKTLFTEHRQLIGTPEYMSPEQAEGSPDIDTRADVYALGVLLYELLTGATPFDARRLRSAAFAEMQRIIKDEEPPAPSVRVTRLRPEPRPPLSEPRPSGSGLPSEPRPSGSGLHSEPRPPLSEPRPSGSGLRISEPRPSGSGLHSERHPAPLDVAQQSPESRSGPEVHAPSANQPLPHGRGSDPNSATTIAYNRRTDPTTLLRALRGELDWIVMKSLDKDRARRYETPNQLAADVQRHLSGEPVLAAPPSTAYRVRKFVRKHKFGVLAAGAVTAALLLGMAGTTTGMFWALRERHRADQQKDRSERIAATAELFATAVTTLNTHPSVVGPTPEAIELSILDLVRRLDHGALRDSPLTDIALRSALVRALPDTDFKRRVGSSILENALVVAEKSLGSAHPATSQMLSDLSDFYYDTSWYFVENHSEQFHDDVRLRIATSYYLRLHGQMTLFTDSSMNQWASRLIKCSSQYSERRRTGTMALGEPDTFRGRHDFGNGWAPADSANGEQFISLAFDQPVFATGVMVRERFGCRSLVQVDIIDAEDTLHCVWMRTEPAQLGGPSGPSGNPVDFYVKFKNTTCVAKGVRISVDPNLNGGSVEIDAVKLYGQPTREHAFDAEAVARPIENDVRPAVRAPAETEVLIEGPSADEAPGAALNAPEGTKPDDAPGEKSADSPGDPPPSR